MKVSGTHRRVGMPRGIALLALSLACARVIAGEGTMEDQNAANAVVQILAEDSEMAVTNVVEAPGPAEGRGVRREPVVSIGNDAELKAGDSAEAVVAIGGSARAYGRVRGVVVAIGGNAETTNDVRETVVAIGGNAIVRGKVDNTVVAILGDINLDPGAQVRRDVIAIGGRVNIAEGAAVHGHVQEIDIGPWVRPNVEALKAWFVHCVFKLRPLAFQPGFWLWAVWGVILLVYLLVAVTLPRPVRACVHQLATRPATTFLAGFAMTMVLPIVFLILALTGVGLLVLPFLAAALLVGSFVGKAGMLEYFGEKIAGQFGLPSLQPLLAFMIGGVLVTLLYLVPVLGFVVMSVIGFWSFGSVVTASLAAFRRERPPRAPQVPAAGGSPAPPVAMGPPLAAGQTPFASEPGPAGETVPPATAPLSNPALPAGMMPRAGFWLRMGAGALDAALITLVVLVVANSSMGHAFGPPGAFFLALAYFAGMWAWKGTTFGGTVFKLQVLDYEGRTITFVVALVRALAAAFSIAALFLGFFWIGWDSEKQGWHDRIAGTVVVRLPRSRPLVMVRSAR